MNYKALLISALALTAMACKPGGEVLTVIHAGSLTVPFQKLEAAFEAAHPGVDVRRQAHGSAMAIRQVTELDKRVDIVASADWRLIDRMMIQSDPAWASWNLLFASNALCLALRPGSDDLPDGWLARLKDPSCRVGISNPNNDPCGYRSLMALYLAQETLGADGLFDDLVLANTNIEVRRTRAGATLDVPASFKIAPRGRLVVRPKETDLLPLLEAGAIHCLLIYRSVARQHGLTALELPPQIALDRPDLDGLYGTVSVRMLAGRPEAVTVRGSAIVYGLTVPSNAPRRELAMDFVRLIQSAEGKRILRDCGQPPLPPGSFSPAGDPDAARTALEPKGNP